MTFTISEHSTFSFFSLLTVVFLALIRKLFVTFFKASTRHSCFHVANSVYAHWLSFEPDIVIQSSVSFDTEVEST